MMKRIILAASFAIITAPAFAQAPPTIDFYMTHPKDLGAKILSCDDGTGIDMRDTPDCNIAKQAFYNLALQTGFQRMREHMARDEADREAGWRRDPGALAEHLKMCAALPQAQELLHCAEAMAVGRELTHQETK